MAEEDRNTPSAFDIFGSRTGESTSVFDLFDTRTNDVVNEDNYEDNKFPYDELPIFGLGTNDFTPEENDWIDTLISAPRGLLRGTARTIPLMGEGVWGLLDLATNLTGNEDYLNPKESAFIERMDELRDAIGYEDSVPGKVGEALGSVLGFVGTTVATGGAGAASRIGAGYSALKAGQLGATGATKTLASALQLASPGISAGTAEGSQRMREYEERTGEEIPIADRNLTYFLTGGVGSTEVLPIVRPLSMLFSKINKTGLPKRTLDTYLDIAKSAVITGTAEGVQEALAGIGQDAIAKGIYDDDAIIGESIASEFGYGGAAGAIFDVGINLITKGRPRGGKPVGEPEEGSPIPEEPIPSGYRLASEDKELKEIIGDIQYPNLLSRDQLAGSISRLQKIIEIETDPIILESASRDLDALILAQNSIDSSDDDDLNSEEEQEVIDTVIPKDSIDSVVLQAFGDEEIVLPDPVIKTEKEVIEPNEEIINATQESAQEEIERTAQVLKDEVTPVIKDLQQDIETESFKQQRTKVEPKLTEALDKEIELENKIQTAEDSDNLNEADQLRNQLDSVQIEQQELIKKEASPIKRSRLIESFNRPDDNEIFTARFPDKESIDTYNDKKGNFKKIKTSLGITTSAYKNFKRKYDNYVTDTVKNSFAKDNKDFKLKSFKDLVTEEQGSIQPEQIIQALDLKNISSNDNSFKRYLNEVVNKPNLKNTTGLDRKELFRQISILPTMKVRNSPIDEAFTQSRDNVKAFNKQEAIANRVIELKKEYTRDKLLQLAAANGVSEDFLYDTTGKRNSDSIAKGIARQEINNNISAEENYEQLTTRTMPNLQVRKIKTSKARQSVGEQQYQVTYPDSKKYKVHLPAALNLEAAKDQAARNTFGQRILALEKENIRTKTAPEASERDFEDAVTRSLYTRQNPLAELRVLAGPQIKQSITPAYDTVEVKQLQRDAPNLDLPNLDGINYQGNLYNFNKNVDANDFVMNLKRIVKRVMPDANIAAVDNLFNVEGNAIAGVTIGDMIAINLETNPKSGKPRFASPTDTVFHEAIHYFINNNYFKPEVIDIIKKNEQKIFQIARNRLQAEPESLEEALAIASGVYNEARESGKIPFDFSPPLRRFFEPIFKYFNQVAKFLSGRNYRTLEDVLDAVRTGELYQDAVNNPVVSTVKEKQYVKEVFESTGYQGGYKGGSLSSGMNANYNNERNLQPFFSNTTRFGSEGIELNDTGFRINLLKEAVKETQTKSTKGKNWLTEDKQGRFKITGSSTSFSPMYIQETNLKEWLDERAEVIVTKEDINNYIVANDGIFSIVRFGSDNNITVLPEVGREQDAIKFYQKQAQDTAQALSNTTKSLQSLIINRDGAYKILQENYYDGPVDQSSAAFYDLTRNLDQIEKAYSNLGLDEINKNLKTNFELIRIATNTSVKSPDYIFSQVKAEQLEQVVNELTLNGNILKDKNALKAADPDGYLEKFLVALSNKELVNDEFIDMLDGREGQRLADPNEYQDFEDTYEEFSREEKFGEEFYRLVKLRKELKDKHNFQMNLLYKDSLDRTGFYLNATNENNWGKYINFNIDTNSGKLNRIERFLIGLKSKVDPEARKDELKDTMTQGPYQFPSDLELVEELGRGFISESRLGDVEVVYTENKTEYLYTYNKVKSSGDPEIYRNEHFKNIDNIFLHIRTADVFVNDGDGNIKKILFVEEIQSDMFADIKSAKEKFLRELNENDPRKIQGIDKLSKEDTDTALKNYPTTANMGSVPLIGYPKPNFNRWQDYAAEEINKLANNNAYDGYSIATSAIQKERNLTNLQNNFDFISFYPSVDVNEVVSEKTIANAMSTDALNYTHTPSGKQVSTEQLTSEGFLAHTDTDGGEFNQDTIAMAAAEYFGTRFADNPSSYEFKNYVTHARLVGMLGGFISRDLTLPLINKGNVYEHSGTTTIKSNYLGGGLQSQFDIGSVESVLPSNLANLINKQIQNGTKPKFKRLDINNITAEEFTGDPTNALSESDINTFNNSEVNTDRLFNNRRGSGAIGAGFINLGKLNSKQVGTFFQTDGADIYDNAYPQKLQKATEKLYGVKPTVLGKSAREIAKEKYPKIPFEELQNKDWHSNKLYDAPYDELIPDEQYIVDAEVFSISYEIQQRKGIPLLLSSAFKPRARQMTNGQPTKRHIGRFNVPVYLFESKNQVQVKKLYKYSSTPADAQRASTWARGIDFLRNISTSKYFSGLGGVPQLKDFMKLRYKTFGQIILAEEAAKELYNDIGPYLNPHKTTKTEAEFKQNRIEFTQFMEGGMDIDPAIIQDEGLRKVAIKSKNTIDNVGKLLVQRGLLPRSKYEENKGAYLARLYMKHVLNYPNGQPLSYLKKRKELDDETKMILGDIAELSPEYRVLNSVNRPLRDMVILDFFDEVSQNQNWALRDGDMLIDIPLENGSTRKVSALWAMDESIRLEEQAEYFQTLEPEQASAMRNKAKEYRDISTPVLETIGYGENNPTDDKFRRMPKTKKYGMLKGVAVRKEIYDDVIGTFTLGNTDNAYNKAIATMAKGTSIWKLLKVPLNPPSVVRNVGSNMILMNLVGGIPIHKVMPRMYQAIKEIQNNGKHWQIAKDFGIKSTGFSEQEMYQISETYLEILQEQHPLGSITRFFSPKILINKIFKKAGDIYQFTESVGKTAVIIDAMERQGMSDIDAFMLAQKALFDYSDVPEAGRQFRKAPIGMPFFTFYYKALPALIETAMKHPIRFAPYVALSAGLTELAAYAFDFEEDEDKKLQKSLQPWLERRTGVYVLPFKDTDNRFQFLDIGYFFPWTMYTDSIKAVSNGEFAELQRTTGLFSGPFVDILLAMKTNKDPFTQRTIWDEREPTQDKIQNLMWYMYSLGMPSWLTPNGAISKTVKAIADTPRPTGVPADTVPQALLRFVGVNVYGIDTEDSRSKNINSMKRDINEIERKLKFALQNQSLTPEKRERLRASYRLMIKEKVDLLQLYIKDTSIPRYILERESKLQ